MSELPPQYRDSAVPSAAEIEATQPGLSNGALLEVEQSRLEGPPLVEIEPGHNVACFNPVPAEEWERTRAAATA